MSRFRIGRVNSRPVVLDDGLTGGAWKVGDEIVALDCGPYAQTEADYLNRACSGMETGAYGAVLASLGLGCRMLRVRIKQKARLP